jgi:BirA family biotin operon repressor/biotin-[acetyl-CoA-carboxylase] ligase
MADISRSVPIVHRLASTASTQLLAAQRAALLVADHRLLEGMWCEAWVAESQLSGRGQHHRFFASPPGGFYATILLAAPDPLPMDILPLAVGYQCTRLLIEAGCPQINIRWPNDLCLGVKKVGGILCQSVVNGDRCVLLVGVGINTNTSLKDFPSELHPYIATLMDAGVRVDHERLLQQLIESLQGMASAVAVQRFAQQAASYDGTRGRTLTAMVDGVSVCGVSESWGADGHLRLRTPDGVKELTAATICKIDGQKTRFED